MNIANSLEIPGTDIGKGDITPTNWAALNTFLKNRLKKLAVPLRVLVTGL